MPPKKKLIKFVYFVDHRSSKVHSTEAVHHKKQQNPFAKTTPIFPINVLFPSMNS